MVHGPGAMLAGAIDAGIHRHGGDVAVGGARPNRRATDLNLLAVETLAVRSTLQAPVGQRAVNGLHDITALAQRAVY
jgi:hypothetical protein